MHSCLVAALSPPWRPILPGQLLPFGHCAFDFHPLLALPMSALKFILFDFRSSHRFIKVDLGLSFALMKTSVICKSQQLAHGVSCQAFHGETVSPCTVLSHSVLLSSAFCFMHAPLLRQESVVLPGEHPHPLLPRPVSISSPSPLPFLQAALIGAILIKSSSFQAFLSSLGVCPFS